jgi:hypothetical protein
MSTAMGHKCCVQFAITRHLITLDKILETCYVCVGFLAKPEYLLLARYLACLGDLQITTIAPHLESILGHNNF